MQLTASYTFEGGVRVRVSNTRDVVAQLEQRYRRQLPHDYAEALRADTLARYEGKRPPMLPGWAAEMSYPLTFDPDTIAEIFEGQWWTADHAAYLPLARFLTDDGDQLHDMEDFLAIDANTGAIVLCDQDGDIRNVAKSLSAFLTKLRPKPNRRVRRR